MVDKINADKVIKDLDRLIDERDRLRESIEKALAVLDEAAIEPSWREAIRAALTDTEDGNRG